MTINFFDLPIEEFTKIGRGSSEQYTYKTIKILEGDKSILIEKDTMSYPVFHIASWSQNHNYLIGELYENDHDELFLSGHYLVYKVLELINNELVLEKMKIYRPESITYDDKYAVVYGLSTELSWELINLETFDKKTIIIEKGWRSIKLDYIEEHDLYLYDKYKYINFIKTEALHIRYKNGDYEINFADFESFRFKLTNENVVLFLEDLNSVEKNYKIKIDDLLQKLKD